MPYARPDGGFERASRLGQVDMAKSEVVREAMARWETPAVATEPPVDLQNRLLALADLPAPERPDTTYVLAFDGSIQEVAAREEGGFKWSSQHLESEVKDGTTAGLDGDADGASGDAVARATSGSPRCREAVLVEDR
jgi:hypothetical protein